MKSYNVAVVGATGMVGQKMLQVLAELKFPVKKPVSDGIETVGWQRNYF